MKKKLTKKENAELYLSLNEAIKKYRKANRKKVIETEIIPWLINKHLAKHHCIIGRDEAIARAKEIFENIKADNGLDELYNLKERS